MHYLGFVFVKEPTKEAVAEAMADHKDQDWDWYRCGGRWDGYLQGADEQKRHETENGFNFSEANDNAERNCCRVPALPADKRPHFFVSGYEFVPRQYYDRFAKSPHGKGYGAIVETPDYDQRFQDALEKHVNEFVVVVDAHN